MEQNVVKIKRVKKAKPGELRVQYGKFEGEVDLFYAHGGSGAAGSDAKLLSHFFESVRYPDQFNLRQELERRGYDLSTLVFSIQQRTDSATSTQQGES